MEILDDEILLTEKELLYSIWTKPTLTFTYIFKYCPKKYVTLLLILEGIVSSLERSYLQLNSQSIYAISIYVFSMLLSGIFGWIFGWFYAALLSWTGSWIKGRANSDQFITVIAWSLVPTICSLILVIPRLLILGWEPFYFNLQEQGLPRIIAFSLIGLVELGFSLWTIAIEVKGIAFVQNFSTKKAVLNMILSFLVIAVPIFMIAGVIYIFS